MSVVAIIHPNIGSGPPHVLQFLARSPFNNWGYDQGISSIMTRNSLGLWELEILASWLTYLQLNVFSFDEHNSDVHSDGFLDHLPPNSDASCSVSLSVPPHPHLFWTLVVNDTNLQ